MIGSLDSLPKTSFAIDFYATGTPDPLGYGEGQRWLGSVTVTTNARGNATINVTLQTASSGHEYVTATATRLEDHDGDPNTPLVARDTSEFSAAVEFVPGISGGTGSASLSGGGKDISDSGAGDTLLVGASGQILLEGDDGSNRVIDSVEHDNLIAGWLDPEHFDRDTAVSTIMAEWTSYGDYQTRAGSLTGSGPGERADGDYWLAIDRTIRDDQKERKEVLTASAGDDWFFSRAGEELATDLNDDIFANDLEWILSEA